MFFFEEHFRLLGFQAIAGIDEAGRGPLAGPVVAAALIIGEGCDLPEGINDSKKLSRKKRRKIYEELLKCEKLTYGVGIVEPEIIDEINILQATHLAMRKAVEALPEPADYLLVDGLPVAGLPLDHRAIVKGDSRSISIAAASIIAKETRDDLMLEASKKYPQYGFERHMGYGTKLHMEALTAHGPCPLHRRSFAPVRKAEK